MWDLYTRSPDIPGPPRSLHRSSLQDLFTRPLWEVSIQDPLVSLDLLGLFTGALYKISSQDLYERSLYNSSLQDLFTRPLWEISSEELSARSLHKTSMRDLYTRALYKIPSQDLHETSLYKISWYPWTSEIFSLQDLFKRPRSGSNTQKVPRGLRGRNQNRHRATARAIRHARTPQRVARAETKNAPGWAPATFHQQNEHGATARAIRHAQSPEMVAFANIKSAPRHSETQKIRVPTAPWRQNYNTKCDFSMFCDASTAPATKKWVRGIRSPVTATRNDVNIADPNSTTVSQNEHFELSKTDFKSTKYCACHEKDDFSPPPISSNPYDDFAHLSKPSRFAHFRISENRHGAQARTHLRNGPRKDPVSRRRNANVRSRPQLFTERVAKKSARVSAHHRSTPDAFHLP